MAKPPLPLIVKWRDLGFVLTRTIESTYMYYR